MLKSNSVVRGALTTTYRRFRLFTETFLGLNLANPTAGRRESFFCMIMTGILPHAIHCSMDDQDIQAVTCPLCEAQGEGCSNAHL